MDDICVVSGVEEKEMIMSVGVVKRMQEDFAGKSEVDVLRAVADRFNGAVVFASSLGVEDQVITDMIARNNIDIPIFTLDTGRLFQESYELIAETEKRYGIKIRIFFPDSSEVENMVHSKGVNLFYDSVESRKECCRVRKLLPLRRALAERDAWICGLRKEQSVTREEMNVIEWDDNHKMVKINPLIEWSERDVWEYVNENKVPYNPLHDKGFLSIGCSCCTRAVAEDEDVRAGRWWWEAPEHKECGLHFVDGKVVRG